MGLLSHKLRTLFLKFDNSAYNLIKKKKNIIWGCTKKVQKKTKMEFSLARHMW